MEQLESRRLLSYGLDLTFGEGGIAPIGDQTGDLLVVHEIAGGKIVAAGMGHDAPFVARFNADGTLDKSFDGDGELLIAQSANSFGNVPSATLLPDGKILLTFFKDDFSTTPSTESTSLYRFNADGTLDSSFGSGGKLTLPPQLKANQFLVAQSDGRILLSLYTSIGGGNVGNSILVRLNADGSSDDSFRGGLSNPTTLPGNFLPQSGAVGADGKIYLVTETSDEKGQVLRLNSNGTVDTSFSGDGIANLLPSRDPHHVRLHKIAVDTQGRALVASQYNTPQSNGPETMQISVTRLTTSGQVDTSFGGGGGLAVIDTEGFPLRIIVDPNGKIVGSVWGSTILAYRLNSDGSPDTSFAPAGMLQPNRKVFEPSDISLDGDGNLLLSGQASEPYFLAVARVTANPGNVVLSPTGDLIVSGTSSADAITFAQASNQITVDLNGATQSFAAASVHHISVFAGDGDDVITLPFAIKAHLEGGNGDDAFDLGDGNMTVLGGTGDDDLTAGSGDRSIDMGDGNNHVATGAGHDNVATGAGNDKITTGSGGDVIHSGNGDDSITTRSGNDRIYTSAGKDTVSSGSGDDIVQDDEPPPPDSEASFSPVGRATGAKFYDGGDGNDSLFGSMDNDTLSGGEGNDTIFGSNGSDSIDGGNGADSLNSSLGDIPFSFTDSDTVNGGAGNDTITGDYGNDLLSGNDGNDTIDSQGGHDTVYGGAGNDSISGFTGADTVYGEDGNDVIGGSEGDDSLWGGAGSDSIIGWQGVDSIYGNGGNDTLRGGEQSDHMRGNGGHDRMYGNGGNDHLYGGESSDRLYAGVGSDQLFGEGGDDRLYADESGDIGVDTLRGGAGNDTFVTRDSLHDEIFGDGGRDSAFADADDLLTSIEVIGP